MPKPKYKAVIFDFDDTLVETRVQKLEQYKYVAKKFYNIDIKEGDFLKHWGKPLHLLVQELYQYSDTLENLMEANLSERHNFPKKLYKDSLNTTTKLLEHGIKVGVLSATTKRFILEDLVKFNFPVNRLTAVQGSDETEVHKPNPDVFLPLLKKLKKEGIKKEEIVYIGDSLDDLQAANGAGIGFIAVTTGLYSKKDFKKYGAKVIIKNIKEVVKEII